MAFNIISVDNNELKMSGRHFSVLERSDKTNETGVFLKYKNGLNINIKSGTTNTLQIQTGLMKLQGVVAENDLLIELVPTPSSTNKNCRLVFNFDLSTKVVVPRIIYDTTSTINVADLTLGSTSVNSDIVVATFSISSVGITNLVNTLEKFDVAGKKESDFVVLPNLTLFQGSSIESENFVKYKNVRMISLISGVKHVLYEGVIPNKSQYESYPSTNWSNGSTIIISPDMITVGFYLTMQTPTRMVFSAFRVMKHNGTGQLNHGALTAVDSSATSFPVNVLIFYN